MTDIGADLRVITYAAAFTALAAIIHGCGGPPDKAHLAMAISARAHAAAAVALEGVSAPAAKRALTASKHAQDAAAAALAAWEAGADDGSTWLAVVPCAVQAVRELYAAMEAIGLSIDIVADALAVLQGFAGECDTSDWLPVTYHLV